MSKALAQEDSIKFVISETVCEKIDEWLKKYPPQYKRSAVVAALLLVQEQNQGWLSVPAMEAVAEYLDLKTIEVYEVATFYDMYALKPVGKHKINICTNIACMLSGAEELVACARKKLGIGLGETTADGLITLRESECLAACAGAPMCQVDDKKYYEKLTPEQFETLISDLLQEGQS